MKRLLASLLCLSLLVGAVAQDADDAPRKRIFLPKSARAAAYILKLQSNEDLVRLVRSEPVYVAMLQRAGLDSKWREEAVAELAKIHETDRQQELIDAIGRVAASSDEGADGVPRELAEMLLAAPIDQLKAKTAQLTALAGSDHPLASQIGLAGLVTTAGDARDVARRHGDQLANLMLSVQLVPDEQTRQTFFPLIETYWDSPTAAVRQAATRAASMISGKEAETLTHINDLITAGVDVDVAVEALSCIPLDAWPPDSRIAIATTLSDFLSQTPASERTVSPAKEAMDLVHRIVAVLPNEAAAKIEAAVAGLTVQQFHIRAPHEQMAFEPNVLVVPAGRPIEVVFTNEDTMPHNFILAEPGRYEDVGLAAQAMATSPEGQAKHYVPENVGVLQASTMLWPGNVSRISFTAPAEPGIYPYICTFPGHWLKMYGAMIVVEDVESYLAENEELPSADELLGKKTVKEWTFADLADDAASLFDEPRSFDQGQRLFTKLSCVSCHKIGQQSLITSAIGPELTEIAKKYPKPTDLLRQIVEPSHQIEDKYASVILVAGGRVVLGVVVKRTESEIHLKENPLVACDPIIVDVADVEDEEKSDLSPMPNGLLNTLYPEEILDLLAYVHAGADASHPVFK